MITVNVSGAVNQLRREFSFLSKPQMSRATADAINKTLLLGRTEARRAVKRIYNIPQKNLFGVNIHRAKATAGKYYLRGDIYASSKPIPLDAFQPRFQYTSNEGIVNKLSISKRGVLKQQELNRKGKSGLLTVEIKRGHKEVIPYAFLIPGAKPRVFARGSYRKGGTYGFIERHTRLENASGNDSVTPMVSITIFGAVVNPVVKQNISRKVHTAFPDNMVRALRRQATMM